MHVPNSLKNKNMERHIPYLLKKMVFMAFCCPPSAQVIKIILSTLNVMFSQKIRNKCIRFDGHVHIEVSYRILQLEILKEAPILLNSPCF
jgi:hypothetical protein